MLINLRNFRVTSMRSFFLTHSMPQSNKSQNNFPHMPKPTTKRDAVAPQEYTEDAKENAKQVDEEEKEAGKDAADIRASKDSANTDPGQQGSG